MLSSLSAGNHPIESSHQLLSSTGIGVSQFSPMMLGFFSLIFAWMMNGEANSSESKMEETFPRRLRKPKVIKRGFAIDKESETVTGGPQSVDGGFCWVSYLDRVSLLLVICGRLIQSQDLVKIFYRYSRVDAPLGYGCSEFSALLPVRVVPPRNLAPAGLHFRPRCRSPFCRQDSISIRLPFLYRSFRYFPSSIHRALPVHPSSFHMEPASKTDRGRRGGRSGLLSR